MAEIEKELTEETPIEEVAEEGTETPEVNLWEEKYNAERDAQLRVAAELDNFRNSSIKHK